MIAHLIDHIFVYIVLILIAVPWVVLALYWSRVPAEVPASGWLDAENERKPKHVLLWTPALYTIVFVSTILGVKLYRPLPMGTPAAEVLIRWKDDVLLMGLAVFTVMESINELRKALTGKRSIALRILAFALYALLAALWFFYRPSLP